MTVKELKELLEKYPDDYIVYIPGGYCDSIEVATVLKEYLPHNNPENKKGILLDEY